MFFKKKYFIIILLPIIFTFVYYKDQIRSFLIGDSAVISIKPNGKIYKVLPQSSEGDFFPGVDIDVYKVVNNERILPNISSVDIKTEMQNIDDPTTINSVSTFKYYLQLASFEKKQQAEVLQKQFSNYKEEVFKNLDYKISLVDIKGKGIYFRLLAGPFENIKKATLVCNDIKKINLNCFPIKEF